MKHFKRLVRVASLGAAGALAAAVVLWVAGPQGAGHRLPADVVPLDSADDPNGASRRLRDATFDRLDTARVSLDLDAVPLAEAIGEWADAAGVSVVVRPQALEYQGIYTAETITLRLRDTPAVEALAEIFGTKSLSAWDIGPAGVIRIPADEFESSRRFLRVYDVTDLLLLAGEVGGRFEPEPDPGPAGVNFNADPEEVYETGYKRGRDLGPPAGTQAAAVAELIEIIRETGDLFGLDHEVRMHHFAGRLGVRASHEEHTRIAEIISALRDAGRGGS